MYIVCVYQTTQTTIKLVQLIYKAEEKLKHENRKKVQTKLQLDQIVLRGISALNMKALALSQNSLNGMDKNDTYF